jgi:secondary thiamine-phosphate synthase enzyme
MVIEKRLKCSLRAGFGHEDITAEVREWIGSAEVTMGTVALQVVGSTGAITTIEYEPGALEDLRRALEEIAPANGHYEHNARWGDGNGFSHLRSALLKTALVVPVVGGELQLGTWQQIVVLNFDNRDRIREVVGVIAGD